MTQLDPLQFDPFDPTEIGKDPTGASTLIGYEHGQWVVYLEVSYQNQVRRHRVETFRTERKARMAADSILRMAMRDQTVLV